MSGGLVSSVEMGRNELRTRIGTDAGRIIRYEGGKFTPSLETHVRLADVLEVSVDYLVREDAPRRNLEGARLGVLGHRMSDLVEPSEADQKVVSQVVDGLLAKRRSKALAGGIA